MKVVAFDIWGEFAHFRQFYTTSSPLTYSFPPPSTVRGIVGAIVGLGKTEYIQATADLFVGVQIISPVRRMRWGENIIFTKGTDGEFDPTLISHRKGNASKNVRTQITKEYLVNPHFRIYVGGKDETELLYELEYLVRNHCTHYTISLGKSELLADFAYRGTYNAEPLPAGTYDLLTVVPVSAIDPKDGLKDVFRAEGGRLIRERMAVYMSANRTPIMFQHVLANIQAKPIRIKVKAQEAYRLDNEGVIYLWPPISAVIATTKHKQTKTG